MDTHENNNWRLVSALSLVVCSVSSQLWLFSLSVEWFLVYTLACLIVIAMSHAHVEWLSLRLLRLSHFPSLHSLYLLALPIAFHFPLPWCRGLKPRALPLRSWVLRTIRTPTQVMNPTTSSSPRLMSSSPSSPWPSNGSLKTPTTTISPSVRRSSTKDEPITLKEKACRLVCRRQWEIW